MAARGRLIDQGAQLRQLRNWQAAQRVQAASDAAVINSLNVEIVGINDSINGGVSQWPLATVAQTLAGAVNELQGEVVALGGGGAGGGSNGYFPQGW